MWGRADLEGGVSCSCGYDDKQEEETQPSASFEGDLTFDDAKESAKEKLQSKTTEKED